MALNLSAALSSCVQIGRNSFFRKLKQVCKLPSYASSLILASFLVTPLSVSFALGAQAQASEPKNTQIDLEHASIFDHHQTLNDQIKHFRVVFNRDPSRQADILWQSSGAEKGDFSLYIDTNDHGLDYLQYRKSYRPEKITEYNDVNSAVVRVSNLSPATKYYFVVRNIKTGDISRRYWFKTTDNRRETALYAVAGGDSRNNRDVRRRSNIVLERLNADVVFFGGDFTSSGSLSQWENWFDDWAFSFSKDGKITPIVATRGNHEYKNSSMEALFNTPLGVYYDVSFHNNLLNLYVLNTETSMAGNQLEWLKTAIAKSDNYLWNTAIYHKPMRPHASWKSEGWNQSKYWAPLFYQYGMDLVVESDTHAMKVTWPIKPAPETGDEGFVRDDVRGTVYVGEGSWGAPLRAVDDNKSWTRNSASINQIKWIEVTQSEMTVRTIKTDNALDLSERVSDNARYKKPKNLQVFAGDGGEITLFQRGNRARKVNAAAEKEKMEKMDISKKTEKSKEVSLEF